MPTPPYALVRASLNGGGVQTGGIAATGGEVVQLTADPAGLAGATQYLWELLSFPDDFTVPAGWSTDANGVYYSTAKIPPTFTLLTTLVDFGKYAIRLTLNGGGPDITHRMTAAQIEAIRALTDTATMIEVPSPTGLRDMAHYEGTQFSPRGWVQHYRQNLRALEARWTALPGEGDVLGDSSSTSGHFARMHGSSGKEVRDAGIGLTEIAQGFNVRLFGASPAASAATNTAAIQAAIDACRAAGGGRIFIPKGVYELVAPYRDVDGIYPGWVANDENRRANKSLIIYDCENIELAGEPGTVLDRSGDLIADAAYAQYSCTLYISKSRNIRVNGLQFLGLQDDAELLDGNRETTSGDNIQINNGCDGVYLDGVTTMDGVNSVNVGMSRTLTASQLDPAIPFCTNIRLNNHEARNGEHGILLMKADGVHASGLRVRTFTRPDASHGVQQRGVYLHSCRNVHMTDVRISGTFKTALIIAYYAAVKNVSLKGLTIEDMMTPAAILAARGTAIDTPWEGVGISFQADNCEDISISDLTIKNCTSGILFPGVGLKRVGLRKFRVDTVREGVVFSPDYDANVNLGFTHLDNPIRGLTLEDGEVRVYENATDYPSLAPLSGLRVESTAVDGSANPILAEDVNMHNVRVFARNRNARAILCNGSTTDCTFTRDMTGGGLAGARNYDFNYSGSRRLANNVYGNHGRPNTVQDLPSAADIKGFVNLDEPAQLATFTVATIPAASLHSGRLVQVSNGYDGSPCLAWSDGTAWWIVGTRIGKIASATPTVVIAAGVITVAVSNDIAVDTEASAASDDLDTINGTVHGQIIVIRAADSARTVVIKDDTGNLRLEGDCTLDNASDRIVLRSNGTTLHELSRSNNGS